MSWVFLFCFLTSGFRGFYCIQHCGMIKLGPVFWPRKSISILKNGKSQKPRDTAIELKLKKKKVRKKVYIFEIEKSWLTVKPAEKQADITAEEKVSDSQKS